MSRKPAEGLEEAPLSLPILSRSLSPDQLASIRDAIGSDLDIPVIPLATRLSKQIDSIRRMAGGDRANLHAVARGTKVDIEAALSPGRAELELGLAPQSTEGRHTWKESEEKELVRLLEEAPYRQRVLGSEGLDYGRLGEHFRKSERAIRKKCWSLAMKERIEKRLGEAGDGNGDGDDNGEHKEKKGGAVRALIKMGKAAKMAEAALPAEVAMKTKKSPASVKRKWLDEENEEMQKLVESEAYRIELGIQVEGSKAIKWSALAQHFHNCKAGQAQKKFQALKCLARTNGGVIKKDRKQNRKHHQKKVAYKWMIVTVMSNFNDLRGTAPDIFSAIEAHDDFHSQLDTSIAPGTQQVPRWRTQVRKTLSAEKIFVNTGTKVDRETVWQLDMATVVDLVAENPKQRTGDIEKVMVPR